MNTMKIKVTNNETIINEWLDQLREYNREKTADRNDPSGKIHFMAIDEDDQILGLVQAEYNWEWLFIKNIIVDKGHRHKGVGTELLKKVEAFALSKKCHSIWLDTFSFQAPEFYKKNGYQMFGKLNNYPENHRRYFYSKKLEVK